MRTDKTSRQAGAISVDDPVRSLLGLWDTTAASVADLRDADWDRPVADGVPDSDVTDLVTHLAGVHYAGPDRLREAVDAARTRASLRLSASPPSERVLAAQCLDMCVHAHDLAGALGHPLDLATAEPAAVAACGLLVGVAPRLLVSAGERDTAVRLLVRAHPEGTPVIDRTLRLHDGRPCEVGAAPVDTVDVTAAGLLLLLTGRRGADALVGDGLAGWSGASADRFVHRARLARTSTPASSA